MTLLAVLWGIHAVVVRLEQGPRTRRDFSLVVGVVHVTENREARLKMPADRRELIGNEKVGMKEQPD